MMGLMPWPSSVRAKLDSDPGLVRRLVKATPLSLSTRAGAPYSVTALVIAAIAALAVSAAAAWHATRVRVQSSRTSNTTTLRPSASAVSVASIW